MGLEDSLPAEIVSVPKIKGWGYRIGLRKKVLNWLKSLGKRTGFNKAVKGEDPGVRARVYSDLSRG